MFSARRCKAPWTMAALRITSLVLTTSALLIQMGQICEGTGAWETGFGIEAGQGRHADDDADADVIVQEMKQPDGPEQCKGHQPA